MLNLDQIVLSLPTYLSSGVFSNPTAHPPDFSHGFVQLCVLVQCCQCDEQDSCQQP